VSDVSDVSDGTLARSRPFVLRYYAGRRDVLTATPRDADPGRLFRQLALAAVPDFAQWVAVVNPSSDLDFSTCTDDHPHSFATCRERWVHDVDLDGALDAVRRSGESVAWRGDDQGPRGVVAPLVVDDHDGGVVVLARGAGAPRWSDGDLVAVHDVVTALGVDLERLHLRYESRLTLQASQRVASQLHQLISASLAVGALDNETAIAQSLARSARAVFTADQAAVSLRRANDVVVGWAQRGRSARLLDEDASRREGLPDARHGAREPWQDDEWLCAPVLDSQRRSRGVVAARRTGATSFGDEDRELAMLLGQLTATSLEALDLNRTIHDNEERLRILVDAAPVGIIESDASGRVRWWNRAASRLLRWPDVAADAGRDLRWPDSVLSPLVVLWRDLLAGGLRDTHEFTATVAGRERLMTASAAVLPSGGDEPLVLTLLDDITDQRELREEVRHAHRMELRGQVASTIAHDFNNLITLILGYAELLSRTVTGDEKAETLVREIQSTSLRASTLTAQLQSIGRTSPPTPVRLDPAMALRHNAEVLERIMGSTIAVQWDLAATTPVTIDADLFEQMILNLSLNARDAMPDGGVLRFTSEVLDLTEDDERAPGVTAGTYVALRIADTGTGMDEVTLAHCFEPLFTTKGPFKGTGLGLASARRLVEESGGVITCTTRQGVGTTFTVWLPAQIASDDTPGIVPGAGNSPVRARIAATILLCEDDDGVRHLARQVLQRHGLSVLEAVSAEDALDVRARHGAPIDVLLSDVVLPAMAGDELAAQLQREEPDLLVVLMSGTARPGVIEGLRPGSAIFVAKPFNPSDLIDRITSLLDGRPRRER
jgi:PAS domain S-box-containing protein